MVDISHGEELKDWLEDKPLEWGQVLAARVALRVLPLICGGIGANKPFSKNLQKSILWGFRATSISWASQKYPVYDIWPASSSLTVASTQAKSFSLTAATSATDTVVANAAHFSVTADHAAAAAHTAAAAAASSTASVTVAYVNSTVHAAVVAAANTTAANSRSVAIANTTANAAIADIWMSISKDCEMLLGYGSPQSAAQSLINEDLWHWMERGPLFPEWFSATHTAFERALNEIDVNWQVWTNWYRSILHNESRWGLRAENAERLTIRLAEQDETFWKQDVTAVNAQIARWFAGLKNEENEQQRNAIKQEIHGLRLAIADTKPAHGGIGHNEPPEGLELSVERTSQVEQAVDVIDSEMDKAKPSLEALTHSASILKTTLLWAAKKADLGVDAFITQLGKVGAIGVVGMYLPIEWQKVYVGIGSVLEKILQWLSI